MRKSNIRVSFSLHWQYLFIRRWGCYTGKYLDKDEVRHSNQENWGLPVEGGTHWECHGSGAEEV